MQVKYINCQEYKRINDNKF